MKIYGSTCLRLPRFLRFQSLVLAVAVSALPPGNGNRLESACGQALLPQTHENPWVRHTIDGSDQGEGKVGADGVRLGDVNADGLPDVVTGWEQGGAIRICLNPGAEQATAIWPAVTVGNIPDVEDAAFLDVDGDGLLEVVSCHEGRTRGVYLHSLESAAATQESVLDAASWKTEAFASANGRQWMFATPADLNADGFTDIVLGAKGNDAVVAWLRNPGNGRSQSTDQWELVELHGARWIMSIRQQDMDSDGDIDILITDRKGTDSGLYWLVNPGSGRNDDGWERRLIGASGVEVMFLDTGDLNGDHLPDIAVTTRSAGILLYIQSTGGDTGSTGWSEAHVELPFGLNLGKGVALADVNLDGRMDLVSTGGPQMPRPSVMVSWLEQTEEGGWSPHRISDDEGHKFDRIEMLDLDADGDLDLLTCEEKEGLGVFWYENPESTKTPRDSL